MRIIIFVLLGLLCGCTTITPKVKPPDQVIGSQDKYASGHNNRLALENRYRQEWEFNRRDTTSPPAIGLALSGGGSRSAAFSIGVLRGLQEIGILEKTDLISSVSGGGYASSWYYFQHFYTSDEKYLHRSDKKIMSPSIYSISDDRNLFDPTAKYQVYLATHGELVGTTTGRLPRYSEYAFDIALTVLTIPVNFVANGIWGWHYNDVPLRRIYQNGIEREYHAVPIGDGNDVETYNVNRILGISFGIIDEADFKEFGNYIIKDKLPFPIINTTAHINDPKADMNKVSSRVFEFTPIAYGSDYFGYRKIDPKNDTYFGDTPISVNKAYAISGAAVDSEQAKEDWKRILGSALNFNLGYYIDNYNLTTTDRILPKVLPFPFYLMSNRYQKDISGTDIYLTDGGHIENLGAFSLIRRLTKTIIISDSEADSHYIFEAYRKLKCAVKNELKTELSVSHIDGWLKKHGCEDTCSEDAIKQCSNNIKSSNQHESLTFKPVMRGKIQSFPYETAEGKETNVDIDVIYIKAMVDPDDLKKTDYPDSIRNYYLLHKDDKSNDVSKFGPFPQQSTTDQTYSPYQISAYHDLGYRIIISNKDTFKEIK